MAAIALGVLAFTRFDADAAPPPGSPGFEEYEKERIRDARLSVALGVAAAFSLLGAFACHDRAGRPRPSSQPPQP
jgi:hypothetical protein